jgi:tetratricopeptide (TPR) repeat protein
MDTELVTVLLNLAELDRRQGKMDDAEKNLQRARKIQSATLGERHPTMAILLNNWGELARAKFMAKEAEDAFRQARAHKPEFRS